MTPQTQTTTFQRLGQILPLLKLPNPASLSGESANSSPSSAASSCERCRGYNYCHYLSHPGFRESVSDRGNALMECQYHLEWRQAKRLDNLFEASELPRQYRHTRLGDCQVHDGNATAISVLIEALETGEWVYVWGASGVGKTQLASAFGVELLAKGRQAGYVTAPELIVRLNWRAEGFEAHLKRAQEVPTLIIDDLGVERCNQYAGEQLSLVLEGRRRQGLQTVLTSEASRSEVSRRYAVVGMRRVGQLLRGVREVRIEVNAAGVGSTDERRMNAG